MSAITVDRDGATRLRSTTAGAAGVSASLLPAVSGRVAAVSTTSASGVSRKQQQPRRRRMLLPGQSVDILWKPAAASLHLSSTSSAGDAAAVKTKSVVGPRSGEYSNINSAPVNITAVEMVIKNYELFVELLHLIDTKL